MRKAFSLITAIIVIILMASIAAFILSLSGNMVKSTTTQYFREQSVLLAKSYTEYAIMAVTANDQNSSNCLNDIHGVYSFYTIDVNISYIGNNLDSSCSRILNTTAVTTPESPLNIIVDVFVKYTDPNHPDNLEVAYHRRSLQKI